MYENDGDQASNNDYQRDGKVENGDGFGIAAEGWNRKLSKLVKATNPE